MSARVPGSGAVPASMVTRRFSGGAKFVGVNLVGMKPIGGSSGSSFTNGPASRSTAPERHRAVPEPSTLALLGLGAFSPFGMRRERPPRDRG